VVTDGKNGLTVPTGDVPLLRRTILRLRDDGRLRERLGEWMGLAGAACPS